MQAVIRDAIVAFTMIVVFAICCVIMLVWGNQMNAAAVVIPFMVIWGLSALLWPAFAVKSLRRYITHSR